MAREEEEAKRKAEEEEKEEDDEEDDDEEEEEEEEEEGGDETPTEDEVWHACTCVCACVRAYVCVTSFKMAAGPRGCGGGYKIGLFRTELARLLLWTCLGA